MSTLSPDRWQEISPHLDHVLSLPESERAGWLQSFRAVKPELADLLEKLLEEHHALAQDHFLEGRPRTPGSESSWAGQTIGSYTLIAPLGQGGMGSVWLAERSDGRFQRRVAIKFLNIALAAQGGTDRFKREGSILGRLAHPHIAELIDAGVTGNGEPYIVLEHVEGEPIDEYCDRRLLDVEARIQLFLDVLNAVAQAHANLIVHRDIKPSNVLVRNDSQVKLLDFGIAKLLADDGAPTSTLATQPGGGALTPQFAAPEQVTGVAVTTATDVYGLGVLLYLLLTGQHPAGPGPHTASDLVKAIVDREAPRLSDMLSSPEARNAAEKRSTTPDKLARLLQGDLDTVVGKALKKNPQERYTSVTAMAEDLRRYLRHQPISARPDTLVYRATKFVRRNTTAVILATLATIALMGGIAGTLIQARTARRQRDLAFRQLARAERINDLNQFLLNDAGPSNATLTVNDLLERAEHIVQRENYANDPANHVELLILIGTLYDNKGQSEKAVPLLNEAYQLSRGLQEPSARAKASCALASVIDNEKEHDRAKSLIEEGLRELPDNPQFALDRAFCLWKGSSVASGSGAFREAIALDQEAARIMDNSIFESNYLKLTVLGNLATDYRDSELRLAIAALERQSVLVKDLGYDDTKTAAAVFSTLGFVFMRAGRPQDAERLYRRSMNIIGENAVNAWGLEAYASALRELGRLDEAASYADRACTKAKNAGNKSLMVLTRTERARIYREQRDFTRAEVALSELGPLMRAALPPGHFFFAAYASELSLLAYAQGNSATAQQFADQAVAMDEAAIAAGHEGAAPLPVLLERRAELEVEAGLADKAQADAERAIALLQASLGTDAFSTHVGAAQMALGRAFQAQGKTEQARSAFVSATEHFEKTLGPDHPDTRAARQLAGISTK